MTVNILQLFLTVTWIGPQCVIVVFLIMLTYFYGKKIAKSRHRAITELLSYFLSIKIWPYTYTSWILERQVAAGISRFEEVYYGKVFRVQNVERERWLAFNMENDLVVSNSCFRKRESYLVAYSNHSLQIHSFYTGRVSGRHSMVSRSSLLSNVYNNTIC